MNTRDRNENSSSSKSSKIIKPVPRAPQKSNQYKIPELRSYDDYLTFKRKHDRCIVFYGTKWCKACTTMDDIYRRIARRYKDYVAMAHCDIDVAGIQFSAVPIFSSIYKGEEINSVRGSDVDGLKDLVKEIILYDRKKKR